MQLDGQAKGPARRQGVSGEAGYAMAALLVAMSIMAIMLTVTMPVWKQTAQREKEAELVFRGEQYVHAIGLFQRKMGPGVLPPSVDVLVQQRFLRRKFKDPITNDDFLPLTQATAAAASAQPGGTAQSGGAARGGTTPSGATPPPGTPSQSAQSGGRASGPGFSAAQPSGGIMGVVSKSKDKSIRLYNGRSHYNEWAFIFTPQAATAGAVAPGAAPGQGQRQGGPGQPGAGPFGGRGNPPGGPGRGTGPGGRGFPPMTPPQPIRRPGG